MVRRYWRVAAGTVLVLVAIGAGLIVVRTRQAAAWTHEIERGRTLMQAANSAYKESQNQDARPALSAYLAYLDAIAPSENDWKAGEHPWLDARGLAFEKMLVAGRLAIVQERRNDSTAATASWTRAEDFARAAQVADPGRPAIRATIDRLDGKR